jgi:hypothetical protein
MHTVCADLFRSSQAFVQHYYTTFDAPTTRASLASLYQPQSMLTFEGSKLMARRRLLSSHRVFRTACTSAQRSSAPARREHCLLRHACVIRPRGCSRCARGGVFGGALTVFALSWPAQGGQAIVEKLTSLPFGQCQHQARGGAWRGCRARRRLRVTRFLCRRLARALTRAGRRR